MSRPPPRPPDPHETPPSPDAPLHDPDFAREVLEDLYRYPGKRRWLAWLLWATLGWLGAHRFYLERHGTAILMLLTGGGFLVWWVVDAFRLGGMVSTHNDEQARRKAEGLPPLELDFMPPLSREMLARPAPWTERWSEAGAWSRGLRTAGDVTVLVVVGVTLGAVARESGVWEAPLAILALVVVTAAGAGSGRAGHLPLVRDLVRWSHRVRLFYYYNRPGNPLVLLTKPALGALLAPFRRRDRSEVKLYLELGGVFTLAFLLLDLGEAVVEEGAAALTLEGLTALWVREATLTFLVIYGFAAPIGAVLTLHLLVRPTHTVPRVLGATTLVAILLGLLA